MPQNLIITNSILFDDTDKRRTNILVEGGIIRRIGEIEAAGVEDVFDAGGRVVAPGYIDVHIQGAGGSDVLDNTPEALQTISQTSARYGTTSFLATTVFLPNGNNEHLSLAGQYTGRNLGGANLLGIHLEGPFIAPTKRGMIQPECICSPSQEVFDKILDMTTGKLRMMTIAPELGGCLDIIHSLADSNIVASFGHSHADYEQTLEGIKAGISHVTHLFNAMASLHHRAPGPLAAILENGQVSAQVIADGIHIQPPVVRLAFNILGPEQIVLITDGMQAMGLPEGKYIYNGIEYESKDGTARYKDGTLIGTALGLSEIVSKCVQLTGCTLEAAVKTVTENPAKLLGIYDKKGSITVDKDADLVLLEKDYSVYATIVGGKVVFQK